MTQLALVSCQKVKESMDNFERFLRAYDLSVVLRQENATNGTIALTINATCFQQAKWLSGLAFDLFEDGVLGMTTEFEAMPVKRAA